VSMVLISGDRLYSIVDTTLKVWDLSNNNQVVVSEAQLDEVQTAHSCGAKINSDLFISAYKTLYIFKDSQETPLTLVKKVEFTDWIRKMYIHNNRLVLGGFEGNLSVVNIHSLETESVHLFEQSDSIRDIIALPDSRYLLAAVRGLLLVEPT
jgi:hypothetical protein